MKNKYFLLLTFVFLGFSVFAQTTVWKNEGAEANWNTVEAWTNGIPVAAAKTVFNVPASSDCIIDTPDAIVKQLVIGDNTPYGGKLIVKNGGVLTCDSLGDWSTIGYNEGGLMVIEKGGEVKVNGKRFHVGLVDPKAEGLIVSLDVQGKLTTPKFEVNGGSKPGWDASCYVFGGGMIKVTTDQFNLGAPSVTDVTGGTIIAQRDISLKLADYITAGLLTAEGGAEDPFVEVKIVGTDTTTWITSSTTVGIDQYKNGRATAVVYPNPATDIIHLQNIESANVKIYNIAGQVVLTKNNTSMVNVQALKPGSYFVLLEKNGTIHTSKLIKQ